MPRAEVEWASVSTAFSKQSAHFDDDDFANPVLRQWREQVYKHVDAFIKPESFILELNSGTGIDALRFASKGHRIHATDLSAGMIGTLKKKISQADLYNRISVQQVSFEKLQDVNGNFDFVFSNFGGLNCSPDLKVVVKELPRLLAPGAYVTLVIMPPVAPWEWSWVLKGKFNDAFRRLKKTASAHLENEYFSAFYYSLSDLTDTFGSQFQLVRTEALGVFSPPPASTQFVKKYPVIAKFLTRLDHAVKDRFPFNRWGDHIIVTFQFISR